MARKHHPLWVPSAEDRAVAHALGAHAAFLPVDGGWVYVARPPTRATTAVLDLVQAAYERFPGRAHAVLRQRIRTTAPIAPLDRAVVEVAAKRLSVVDPHGTDGDGHGAGHGHPALRGRLEDLGPWVLTARAHAGRAHRDVAATLRAPDGRTATAANTAATNRTLHAELNLVQAWVAAHGPIPAGATVETALQPCRMCAALLVRAAEGRIDVVYATPDPGRLARGTALQALGWERRG
ncbi:MAG: Bd3614 family nucleic acid deaminase [Myxococcota bacterium]